MRCHAPSPSLGPPVRYASLEETAVDLGWASLAINEEVVAGEEETLKLAPVALLPGTELSTFNAVLERQFRD